MSATSPFAPSRYEHEGEHLYYLPPTVLAEIAEQKPIYLVGTRGTGKTTLLKSLDWSERLSSSLLRKELTTIEGGEFAKCYIGLYFKLPDQQLDIIDSWVVNEADSIASRMIAWHLDLLWLELLCDAVSSLAALGHVPLSAMDEEKCVADIFAQECECSALREMSSRNGPTTLRDLLKLFRAARYQLESLPAKRVSFASVAGDYPSTQMGAFGRAVARRIAMACDGIETERKWHFKVCMDEGECLNERQQRVMNSLVRSTAWPVFPVVAYVSRPADSSATYVHGLTVSSADRKVVVLDEIHDNRFKELAEGVANIRIQNAGGLSDSVFSTEKTLGALDFDKMLGDMLAESVNPEAIKFLHRIEGVRNNSRHNKGLPDTSSNSLQIIEAYLSEKLGREYPDPAATWAEKRKDESENLRKKFVAAYLSICTEFKLKVRYAFGDMMLQLSDGCIRDFLSQLHEVFIAADTDLTTFCNSTVPWRQQDAGLQIASENKRASFMSMVSVAPKQSSQIVEALGQLTARVQSWDPLGRNLSSPERGRFHINSGNPDDAKAGLLDLIDDSAQAGYLRIVRKEPEVWVVKVHTSLAPKYGFSYRGAFYKTWLRVEELETFRKAGSQEALSKAIDQVARRILNAREEYLPLFDSATDTND